MKLLLPLLLLPFSAFPQGSVPPPIIQIVSKPGYSAGPIRPYASGRAGVEVVGLSAATGLPQTWMIEMHPTFASIENLDRALIALRPAGPPSDPSGQWQDDLAAPPRTMIAVLQARWSYRPDDAMRGLAKTRYIRVTIHRIRTGLEASFGELVRLRKLTNDSINLDRPELVYHVISGASSGTYVVLSPLTSLSVMDEGTIDVPVYAAPLAETRAKAEPNIADIVIDRERVLFRVEPWLSYVSDEFAAGDPAFWRPKADGQ